MGIFIALVLDSTNLLEEGLGAVRFYSKTLLENYKKEHF